MNSIGHNLKDIRNHLSKDSVLHAIMNDVSLPKLADNRDMYSDLIKSIVSQQLSVKAADTIFGRFLDLFDGLIPSPSILRNEEIQSLRSAGLSNAKSKYVVNIAVYFDKPENSDRNWDLLTDDEIFDSLCSIVGVGRWTAQMILMFNLGRPDILPVNDVGLQNSFKELYPVSEGGKELQADMEKIAENWRPWRTYACYLLWHQRDAK